MCCHSVRGCKWVLGADLEGACRAAGTSAEQQHLLLEKPSLGRQPVTYPQLPGRGGSQGREGGRTGKKTRSRS